MRHLMLFALMLLLVACNLQDDAPSSPEPDASDAQLSDQRLLAAWVQGGNLWRWETGDSAPQQLVSGGVVRPFIAPDGQHIAFTRGSEGAPETLWLVDWAGRVEQELVGEAPASYRPGAMQIGDVVWLDGGTLYFNTLSQSQPTFTPQHDLFRARIATGAVSRLLVPTEGGRIAPSPDGSAIVLVYPGTYGVQDGRIRVLDTETDGTDELLFFVGVATGSEFAYYPDIAWLPDSSAVLVAIPDKDLVYSDAGDDLPPTRLWQLPIDNPGERELLNSVQASYFGQPVWSDDGRLMLFLRREAGSNNFSLYVASRSGQNERPYVENSAGLLGRAPRWLPDSTRFLYADSSAAPVRYYLGGLGQDAFLLTDETLFHPLFLSDRHYLAFAPGGESQTRVLLGQVGGGLQALFTVAGGIPVLDARLLDG